MQSMMALDKLRNIRVSALKKTLQNLVKNHENILVM